ncbi:MAG: hypothetical protein GY938_12780 [Ketobacter sp.]|nr:hypothetical protein [Ketobacter sp.]
MANTLAHGFVGLESMFSQRVTDNNVATVINAIQISVDEHNRQVAAMTGDMFEFTTEYQVRFLQPGDGDMQPLDQWGNPLPVREEGYYDVAFPIDRGGTAWGTNRETRALQTVADVNRATLNALQRDAKWIKRHMLAALFDNTTRAYSDPDKGALTVQPLANDDAVVYVKRSGTNATDDHYHAQVAAIADATSPFDTIYTDLMEHPVNSGGQVVVYIPTSNKAAVEGLAGFIEVGDPDINQGVNTATISGSIDRGWGDEVIGKVNKCWIIEAGILPDDYLVANVRGSAEAPLWAREQDAAALQGLIREDHSPDGNLQEQRFIRILGFGAYNRVGALVFFIEAGDTTYDIPAGYAAPLAV